MSPSDSSRSCSPRRTTSWSSSRKTRMGSPGAGEGVLVRASSTAAGSTTRLPRVATVGPARPASVAAMAITMDVRHDPGASTGAAWDSPSPPTGSWPPPSCFTGHCSPDAGHPGVDTVPPGHDHDAGKVARPLGCQCVEDAPAQAGVVSEAGAGQVSPELTFHRGHDSLIPSSRVTRVTASRGRPVQCTAPDLRRLPCRHLTDFSATRSSTQLRCPGTRAWLPPPRTSASRLSPRHHGEVAQILEGPLCVASPTRSARRARSWRRSVAPA